MHPIRTDEEHKAALAEIERLWSAEPGTEEHDRLEVLGILVEAYEDERYPVLPPDPIEAIRFRLDQMRLPESWLEGRIGSRARVWEVLNRKRGLSLAMIRTLHAELDIPMDILVAEYEHESPKAVKRRKPSRSLGHH